MWSNQFPPILVYYRFRGQLQPIRALFCYLELPFIEIQLDHCEEQKKMISPAIVQHIIKLKIDRSQLPVLIHGNIVAEGLHPIVCYTCKKYGRQDVLGSDIYIRSKVQEIMQIYYLRQPQVMSLFFGLADLAAQKPPEQINIHARQLFENTLRDSKFVKEICEYLDKNNNEGYIFGSLTVVDFFFLEICIYINGIYSHVDRTHPKLDGWDPARTYLLDKPSAYYLSIIQRYQQRVKSQQWYRKHQQYLQSFSIISTLLPENRAKGLRKLWVGDPKYIL